MQIPTHSSVSRSGGQATWPRRDSGSAVVLVLAILAIVSILSVAVAQTVIRLRSELHHVEKKQIQRLAGTHASKGVKSSP